MFDSDIAQRAQEILERRRAAAVAAIDHAALHAATNRPIIVCKFVSNTLGGLMGILSGADYAANNTGNYYNEALAKLLNSTGSPAAKQFAAEQQAALQPEFKQQDQGLAAKEAAMGITNSGAAKADFSNLGASQAATLAGVTAPLYQSAIGQYGNIVGAEPGAQSGAYSDAMNRFYSALETAATGMPSMPQQSSQNPYTPSYGVVPGSSVTPGAVTVSGGPYDQPADYNPYAQA